MSEKYFVCSESELEELFACAFRRARLISAGILDVKDDLVKAEAACRACEVPEWATHFVHGQESPWQCTGADGHLLAVVQYKEIKR